MLKLVAGKLDQMFGHQYPDNQTFHVQQQLELASQQLSQTVVQGVQEQQEAAAHKQSINSSSSSKSSTAPAAAAHHQKKQKGKGKERGWQRVLIVFVIQ
jgi:ATPase subunit of ABC transporter with duplicated ATPase domains